MKRNDGFSAVEAVLILVVVGIIAFVGYRVYDAQMASEEANMEAVSQSTQPVDSKKPITNANELEKAATELDEADVDGTDASVLDEQLSF